MTSSDLRCRARQVLAGKWGIAVLTALVAGILGGLVVGSGASINLDEEKLQRLPSWALRAFQTWLYVGTITSVIRFILGGPVRQGYCNFLLKMHDGKEVRVGDLFSRFDRFGDGFLLRLLQDLYVALWTCLFIIPGIVKSYSYAMAPFILEENPQMTANEAITASRQLMDGHKFELFCLHWSFFGWALLSALTLGIGSLWLNPYMNAATAAFYRSIAGCPQITVEETQQ